MTASAAQSPNIAGDPSESRACVILIAVPIQLAVVTCAVGLRLYTRGALLKRYEWEDVLAFISWLLVCTDGSLVMALTCVGLGRHIHTLPQPDGLKNYLEIFWFSVLFYNLAILAVNLTILALYHRIMSVAPWRRRVEIVGVLVLAWALGQLVVVSTSCRPLVGFWDKSVPADCPKGSPLWYLNGAGNILLHFVILALPIPVIRKTQLPPLQKFFLLGILSLGFFTCGISVLRIHSYRVPEDFTYENFDTALWSLAELSSGLVCACLPVLRPLLGEARRRRHRHRRRRSRHRRPPPPKDDNPNTTGSRGEKPNTSWGWSATRLSPVFLSYLTRRGGGIADPDPDLEAAAPAASTHVAWRVRWQRRRRSDDALGTTRDSSPDRFHGLMGILSGPRMAPRGDDTWASLPERDSTAEREVGVMLPCPDPTYFPTQAHYQLPHRWRSRRGAGINTP